MKTQERRIEAAAARLGPNCVACPFRQFTSMPTDELEKLLSEEINRRIMLMTPEERCARLAELEARNDAAKEAAHA